MENINQLFVTDVNPDGNETVVFLHGWPLSAKIFEYQFNTLPQYGIRCVGIDLKGYGSSSKPWGGYDYDSMSDAVHNTIRSMNLKKFTLLGFSMGGGIAAKYAAKYGDSLKKLIFLAAAVPIFTQRSDFPYGMTKQQVDDLISNLINDKPDTLKSFGQTVFENDVSTEYFNWFGRIASDTPLWSARKGLEALRDEDLRNDLKMIKVPTAIFHGIKDRVCPYALAEQTHKMIPGSKLVAFEKSGHGIFYEEKDKLNQEIIRFVLPESKAAINNETIINPYMQHFKFVNVPLPYDYNDLEPFIDEKTMRLHHDKHLQHYIDELNTALEPYPLYYNWTLEKLLLMNNSLPESIREKVRRNAGGVYNHFFYFESMAPRVIPAKNMLIPEPEDEMTGNLPHDEIAALINAYYASFSEFKKQFKQKALDVFGSGYAWFVINKNGRPEIIMTANQDTPLPLNMYPLLNIDVWEHAYYLKNFNMRNEYIDNWFNVVNWQEVNNRLKKLNG